ncbi:MAG: fibronectin type III domain-containing protein, partial [Candidatus Nanopelagicales bacterium]
MAAILGLGSSSATAADSAPLATQVGPTVLDIDDDIPPVRNLRRISPANTEYIGNVALIGWERPADQWAVTGYRILYSADFRPQKWMVLETDKTTALLTNLWPARDYTVIVQATSPFGGWGTPAEMALFTAEKSVYRVDAP